MNNFEIEYRKILNKCLKEGIYRNDRTKVGSFSVFNQTIKIDLSTYFPIITGRRIFKNIFETEFEWFLKGETNISRFTEKNINIWDNWANKKGELGPVYGYQMVNFNGEGINQLEMLIQSILNEPDSRRHIISLWNPLQTNKMALPPCYLYFQFFVEGNKLNMFVLQRSGDMFLGVPYDIALFSKMLLYISEKTNLKANKLEIQIIDAHIYKNQLQAINIYLKEKTYSLPKYKFENNNLELLNYICGKNITAKVAI